MVLDTGAVTRGSGAKHEDKERNIRKWFVDHDFIDGVISAAGQPVLQHHRGRCDRGAVQAQACETNRTGSYLLNANRRVGKGRPKNYIPEKGYPPACCGNFSRGNR